MAIEQEECLEVPEVSRYLFSHQQGPRSMKFADGRKDTCRQLQTDDERTTTQILTKLQLSRGIRTACRKTERLRYPPKCAASLEIRCCVVDRKGSLRRQRENFQTQFDMLSGGNGMRSQCHRLVFLPSPHPTRPDRKLFKSLTHQLYRATNTHPAKFLWNYSCLNLYYQGNSEDNQYSRLISSRIKH